LEDGDEIYFYFGQPRRISIPNNTYANIEFSVDSEEYDYVDNAWSSLSDYTVGIFQDDPENPWTQIVFATSTIDETGKSFFTLEKEGDYKIGFEEDYYYPSYDLVISSSSTATDSNSTTTDSGNTNSGGGVPSSNSFDIESAIGFLLESQDSDGGFGPDLYSDWAAVAFSSVDESNNSLKSNVENSSVSSDLYEKLRKSMALLALDLDPQDDFEENLIEEILDEFDGEQFGEESFFNDDIFTLIVLYNLGFDEDDEEISKTIDFILSNQSSSGAFQGVDLTAAAIQALVEFEDYPGVSGALSEAEEYLKNQQNSDGSWGDVYSTSWVMMAMSALKYDFDEWKGDPLQYLGDEQDSDGGLLKDESEGNRIWSTSYAIVAASEKTWIEILNDFSFNKPEESNSNLSGGSARSNSEIEQVGEVLGDTSEEITAAQLITENLDKILLFLDKNKQDKEVDFQSNQVSIPINFEDIELIEVKEEIKDYLNNEYDSFEKKALVKDSRQTAAAINSIDFQRFIYLILAIVALIISVIMFKRK